MFVCLCVYTRTQTFTHTYIHYIMYIHIYMYVHIYILHTFVYIRLQLRCGESFEQILSVTSKENSSHTQTQKHA